jgi:hypothetical protein
LTAVKCRVRRARHAGFLSRTQESTMPDNFGDAFLWMAIAGGVLFMTVLLYVTVQEEITDRRR